MKTKLMNIRVEEAVHNKIKRAAQAAHETVTGFLLGGAAMRMKAMAKQDRVVDPLTEAFEELFRSGKVSPLTPEEHAAVDEYEAQKAAGTLKTVSMDKVLADIEAELAKSDREDPLLELLDKGPKVVATAAQRKQFVKVRRDMASGKAKMISVEEARAMVKKAAADL